MYHESHWKFSIRAETMGEEEVGVKLPPGLILLGRLRRPGVHGPGQD
jgi:hypothetical protein